MKNIKKLDIFIIITLLLLSFVPTLIYSRTLSKDYKSTYAHIRIDSKVYDNVNISSFRGEKSFTIESKGGSNTILVKDNTIKIIDANCKDELCIKQGEISQVGKNIVCLPNKLIIEIKGDENDSSADDMILSH